MSVRGERGGGTEMAEEEADVAAEAENPGGVGGAWQMARIWKEITHCRNDCSANL